VAQATQLATIYSKQYAGKDVSEEIGAIDIKRRIGDVIVAISGDKDKGSKYIAVENRIEKEIALEEGKQKRKLTDDEKLKIAARQAVKLDWGVPLYSSMTRYSSDSNISNQSIGEYARFTGAWDGLGTPKKEDLPIIAKNLSPNVKQDFTKLDENALKKYITYLIKYGTPEQSQ
jgi:hypothetical protein